MSQIDGLGFSGVRLQLPEGPQVQVVIVQRPLDRILSFTGYSIHDVVNNPIAKHAMIGYYKLSRQIQRRSECVDLERQWNP
ncbi:MAG TPA: hypothetical protein VGG44_10585 [Tepidisphaeraceae bacterium]|jgi:hypothetical protein